MEASYYQRSAHPIVTLTQSFDPNASIKEDPSRKGLFKIQVSPRVSIHRLVQQLYSAADLSIQSATQRGCELTVQVNTTAQKNILRQYSRPNDPCNEWDPQKEIENAEALQHCVNHFNYSPIPTPHAHFIEERISALQRVFTLIWNKQSPMYVFIKNTNGSQEASIKNHLNISHLPEGLTYNLQYNNNCMWILTWTSDTQNLIDTFKSDFQEGLEVHVKEWGIEKKGSHIKQLTQDLHVLSSLLLQNGNTMNSLMRDHWSPLIDSMISFNNIKQVLAHSLVDNFLDVNTVFETSFNIIKKHMDTSPPGSPVLFGPQSPVSDNPSASNSYLEESTVMEEEGSFHNDSGFLNMSAQSSGTQADMDPYNDARNTITLILNTPPIHFSHTEAATYLKTALTTTKDAIQRAGDSFWTSQYQVNTFLDATFDQYPDFTQTFMDECQYLPHQKSIELLNAWIQVCEEYTIVH